MKKRVIVGDEFRLKAELEPETVPTVDVDAKTRADESRTRNFLAYGAVAGSSVAIAVSASLGIADGTFDEIQSVWNVAGTFLGAVFGYYFGSSGTRNGKGK